tara:strand:- start:2800 stop:4200 length:1401 start_codon:yes stop_codon:yes gene_type:complete
MSRKINIIDPQYFDNQRACEFRLNETNVAYLTDGAYLCLGAKGTNATQNEVRYNRRAGIAAMVSSIRLLNGGDVLAQLDNAGPWMAWKGLNKDNSNARSTKKLGFRNQALMRGDNPERNATSNFQQLVSADAEAVGVGVPNGSLGTTDATTSVGALELKEFLKELEVLTALPTAVFGNLRLQVRFTTDVKTVCEQFANVATNAVSAITIVKPMLVIESISDPGVISQMMSSMAQMSFTCIESDRFVVPAATDGVRSTNTFTLRGFNDKVLNRVLIVNSPTEANQGVVARDLAGTGNLEEALDAGKLNSIAQYRYTVQCRVNGQAIFNGRGHGFDSTLGATEGAGYNHRLAMTTDTWGDVSLCQAGNVTGMVYGDGITIVDGTTNPIFTILEEKSINKVCMGSDYTGFRVQNRISHLEFDISRTGLATANLAIATSQFANQQLHQIIYGEVPKVLTIQGGSYRVSYL